LPDLINELNARFAALPDIVWELCAAPETLSAGMKVRVKTSAAVHNGVGQGAFGQGAFGQGAFGGAPASFKDATIQKVNDDETFDVLFDSDDETKKNVPLIEMQIQNVSVNMLRFLFSFRKTAERVLFCCFYSHCSLLLCLSSLVVLLLSLYFILYIGGKRIGKKESRSKNCQTCLDKGRYFSYSSDENWMGC
jgi:hypothetical protein